MNVDPDNPVVKCCAEGIQLEMEGKIEEATQLYARAWVIKSNDYEACIAAHYLARVQISVEDILHWNCEALKYAKKVNDESVSLFYPSLYLNIGRAYENMGNDAEAIKNYRSGAAIVNALPDDRLGNVTRDAINRGLERLTK